MEKSTKIAIAVVSVASIGMLIAIYYLFHEKDVEVVEEKITIKSDEKPSTFFKKNPNIGKTLRGALTRKEGESKIGATSYQSKPIATKFGSKSVTDK